MLNEVKHLARGRNWVPKSAGCVSFVAQILRFAQDDTSCVETGVKTLGSCLADVGQVEFGSLVVHV